MGLVFRMKVPVLASLLALAFLSGACEKQSYSETRAFTHHGKHGGESGAAHASEGAAAAPHDKGAAAKPAAH